MYHTRLTELVFKFISQTHLNLYISLPSKSRAHFGKQLTDGGNGGVYLLTIKSKGVSLYSMVILITCYTILNEPKVYYLATTSGLSLISFDWSIG